MTEWISVKDKLPEEYDWVLVTYVDSKNHLLKYVPSVGSIRNGFWTIKESLADPAVKCRDFEKECNVIVTHWMPLPYPPR